MLLKTSREVEPNQGPGQMTPLNRVSPSCTQSVVRHVVMMGLPMDERCTGRTFSADENSAEEGSVELKQRRTKQEKREKKKINTGLGCIGRTRA